MAAASSSPAIFTPRHRRIRSDLSSDGRPISSSRILPFRNLPTPLPFNLTRCLPTGTAPVLVSPAAFTGLCYVVGDNIESDHIVPADHLAPSNPDDLGSVAFLGLPSTAYPVPFVNPGASTTLYAVVVAGANFGYGYGSSSSPEHAVAALGAAGVKVVVAESYELSFLRKSKAAGEVYLVECEDAWLFRKLSTGSEVTVDIGERKLMDHSTGREYNLRPI